MKQEKLNQFFVIYEEELARAVEKYPEDYGFAPVLVPVVAEKMRWPVIRGTFSKDGWAFKSTCKRLGIAYTYGAIKDFLGGIERAD